jgi:hypothetical protein
LTVLIDEIRWRRLEIDTSQDFIESFFLFGINFLKQNFILLVEKSDKNAINLFYTIAFFHFFLSDFMLN